MTVDAVRPVDAKRRVLLIYTGGTIGAEYDPNKGHYVVQPNPELLIRRASRVHREIADLFDLRLISPVMLMSEDIVPGDWEDLADHIERQINFHRAQGEAVSGVVVTHGTDTLPYTASALSFLLQETPIPIVLTGANLPPEQEGSDATDNLWYSLVTASMSPYAGVFVVFTSQNRKHGEIHLGTRLRQILPFEAHFESIARAIVGTVTELPHFHAPFDPTVTPLTERSAVREKPTAEMTLERGVFYFRIHPGFNPTLIAHCLDTRPKAIILELYHSGTLCHRKDSRYDLIPVIAEAGDRGVYVFFTQNSGGPRGTYNYETPFFLERKLGAIPVRGMTIEAVVTKVMWVLKRTSSKKEVEELMNRNLVGEMWRDD